MSVEPVSVLTTVGQPDVDAHPEWCSVDPATLAAIGREVGHQVRIRRSAAEFALYTVAETHLREPPGTVRMGQAGRERLGPATSSRPRSTRRVRTPRGRTPQPRPPGSWSSGWPTAAGGSSPSPRTAATSSRAPTTRPNRFACSSPPRARAPGCAGAGGPVAAPSTAGTSPRPISHPTASRSCTPSSGAVSPTRWRSTGPAARRCWGAAAPRRRTCNRRSRRPSGSQPCLAVRVATADDPLGDNDPRNVVNRLTAGGANGVQIEQPFAARCDHGPAIARSVAIALRARPVSTAAAHRP